MSATNATVQLHASLIELSLCVRVGVVMPVVGLISLCVLCCLIATRCSRIGDEEIKWTEPRSKYDRPGQYDAVFKLACHLLGPFFIK
jgi:hypothetical protein